MNPAMSTISIQHREQEHDRRTGIIVTIVFHALVTLLFLYFGLTQPNPLPEEQGIEIAFESAGGLTGGDPLPNPGAPQESAVPTPSTSTPEEVATEEESPVEAPKPVTPKPKPKPAPETPKPPKPNPNSLFTPSNNPNPSPDSNPGGSGTPGAQPGGGGSGDFKGRGFEGRLEGRGLMRGPNITDKPNEGGKVALNIWVDRDGKVTRVTQNLDKSTTTSTVLFNIAKKGAMQCTFSARADGPAEQMGLLVFIFELE
jgi:outer membrane biosynthesis protein TonB